MHFFITGTDTDVGKTYVTMQLLRALRSRGVDAVGFKPLCCGPRDDAEALRAASDGALTLNEVNPVWLRAPAAPFAAALVENRTIDLDLVRETFTRLRARHATVLVEGIGGWLVPITRDFTVADLAREWQLPVIVVVKNVLGALNHAALTAQAVRATGLSCVGLILNHPPTSEWLGKAEEVQAIARATNAGVLSEWLNVPILAEVQTNGDELSSAVSKPPFL